MLSPHAMLVTLLFAAAASHQRPPVGRPLPPMPEHLAVVGAPAGFLIAPPTRAKHGVKRSVQLGKGLGLDGALFSGLGAPDRKDLDHAAR